MRPNSKRGSTLATVFAAVGQRGRHAGHLLVEALLGAYDSHMERTQMRFAPIKFRSWCEIPRAGAHHDSW